MTQDQNYKLKQRKEVPSKVKISVRSDSDPHSSSIDAAVQDSNQVLKEALTPEEANARNRALGLMIPDNFVRKTYTLYEPRRSLYL